MGRNKGKGITGLIRKNWTLFFILFLAIVGTYYQSLPYPFLDLDDTYYIRDNPYIRHLSWDGIYKIFSRPMVHNYFPLQILSYAIDYQIWHVQPFGYRLHNVILHILNAALVFLLLKKIFSNTGASFLAALLFGLHPVNVESVTWIAERKNVLSMALLLSSFISYLYYLEEKKGGRKAGFYLAALALFLLSLLAKVSAVVLPMLFCLYDLCFQKRRNWEIVRDKIPFLALAILFSAIAVWIYRKGGYLADYHGGSPYTNFLAMINVFVEYIIYLVVPFYLDHLYLTSIPPTVFQPQVLLSIAAIFLLSFLAWKSFQRDRVFFFGLAWFFISLLPVLNILPIGVLRADRYMYLPAIGFFYLVSLGLWKLGRGKHERFGLPVFLILSLLLSSTYAFLTIERNRLWKDPLLFWEENLRKFPQSVVPYRFIGHIYIYRGKYDLAISYFQTGLQLAPNDVELLNGLATAHKSKKDLNKAEEFLIRAIRLHPKDSATLNNLGIVYYQKGEMEKARLHLQKALEINPQSAPACTNLALVFCTQNQWEEAIRLNKRAIEISPCSIEPYLNLALIYKEKGLLDKAEWYLKKSLDYVPHCQSALDMLAGISYEQGKFPEASDYLKRAYGVNPGPPDTGYSQGPIAQEKGDHSFPEAGNPPPPQKQAKQSSIPKNQGRGGL